ncbi:MAG: gamma-glutamylcyclotransferase family protein [Bacteroidota bacterium]
MILFSYGSNMLSSRIGNRIQSHIHLHVGCIECHALRFHKVGQDTSGKADAYFTNNQNDIMWGVVGEINASDKKIMDEIEGLGNGYNLKRVEVKVNDCSMVEAQAYIADHNYIDQSVKPFDWYKEFVYRGALENKLPDHYVKYIETVDHRLDQNFARREENFRIAKEVTL